MNIKLNTLSLLLISTGLLFGLILSAIFLSASNKTLLLPETRRVSTELIDNAQHQLFLSIKEINGEIQMITSKSEFKTDVAENNTIKLYESLIAISSQYFRIPSQLVHLNLLDENGNSISKYLFQPTPLNLQHMKNIESRINGAPYKIMKSTVDNSESVLIVFFGEISHPTTYKKTAELLVAFSLDKNSPLLSDLYEMSHSDCLMLASQGNLYETTGAGLEGCLEILENGTKKESLLIDINKPELTFSSKDDYLVVSKKITDDFNLEEIHLLAGRETILFKSQRHLLLNIFIAFALSLVVSALITSLISKKIIKKSVRLLINHVEDGVSANPVKLDHSEFTIDEFRTIANAYDVMREKLSDEMNVRIKSETDRLKLSEQLQTAHAQKMESLGTLTSGVAHDFNNILMIVMTNLELIDISDSDPDVLNEALGNITTVSERAITLVSDLMLYARNDERLLKNTDIVDVVHSAIALFTPMLSKHKIDLSVDMVDGHPIIVKVNKDKLLVGLLNLLTNARDSIEHEGKITLALKSLSHSEVANIRPGKENQGYCLLEVIDTGTGIGADIIDKVFEPFFTTKEIGRGTGMGLSIVYETVRETGGEIKVIPNGQQGTNIQILLPTDTSDTGRSKN